MQYNISSMKWRTKLPKNSKCCFSFTWQNTFQIQRNICSNLNEIFQFISSTFNKIEFTLKRKRGEKIRNWQNWWHVTIVQIAFLFAILVSTLNFHFTVQLIKCMFSLNAHTYARCRAHYLWANDNRCARFKRQLTYINYQ